MRLETEMITYYSITACASIGGLSGVAYLRDYTELSLLPEQGWVGEWETPYLSLRNGIYTDYLAANIGCRLCSKKLRDILERCKSEKDVLQWLSADVESETGETRRYYILHFPELEDLLDKTKSKYVRNIVTKRIIDTKACAGREIFSYMGGYSLSFVVSQKVKEELKNAKCSGLMYRQISPRKKSYLLKTICIVLIITSKRLVNIVEGMKKPSVLNVNREHLNGLHLPGDLVDFLIRNKSLCYDERKCTVGHVELVTIESLLSGRIYVGPGEESQKKGYYTMPAVDLVAECEGFGAWGILVWLPGMQKFGTWDCDHRQLRVFPKARWSDIVKKPTKYLNALWKPEKVENVLFVPNDEYPFSEEGEN
jgi:hypothetical protein